MENILVLKTEYLTPYLRRAAYFTDGLAQVAALFRERGEFLPRPVAEQDPGYKQAIPYISIRRGGLLFATRRLSAGGETRLHGLVSLGVGGHINPTDGDDPLLGGMLRELHEEVFIDPGSMPVMRGLINDDSNEVGSVHLGFFCTLDTEGEVSVRETEKLEGLWLTPDEALEAAPRMETWSRLILPALLEDMNRYD